MEAGTDTGPGHVQIRSRRVFNIIAACQEAIYAICNRMFE